MNASYHRGPLSPSPTPDELAGIALTVDGVEDLSVRPKHACSLPPGRAAKAAKPPTADDLAGIPVCVEGEDLTVRRERSRTNDQHASKDGTVVLDPD